MTPDALLPISLCLVICFSHFKNNNFQHIKLRIIIDSGGLCVDGSFNPSDVYHVDINCDNGNAIKPTIYINVN